MIPIKTRDLKKTSSIFLGFILLIMQFSCDQRKEETDNKTENLNTYISVSLWQDSLGVDPVQLFAELEKVNIAIDSIGFPDAGYTLWEVIDDDTLNFRYMVEGSWPDKETYELIHDHELYQESTNNENAAWSGLKNIWYQRFNRIKE